MMETIFLGLLAGYLIWRLYQTVLSEKARPTEKIRLISKETGEVIEMQVVTSAPKSNKKSEWSDDSFVTGAKLAFQKVMHAFAKGDLPELKKFVSPAVYTVWEKEIVMRQQNKAKMDFSLICFNTVRIHHKNKELNEITVEFVTDQINLLKDEKGEVIEGDPMNISTMTDTWVFKKVTKNKWIISATQSRSAHV